MRSVELILKSVTCLRTFVCHILFITVNCWRSKIISAPSGPSWGSSGNSKSFSKKNLNFLLLSVSSPRCPASCLLKRKEEIGKQKQTHCLNEDLRYLLASRVSASSDHRKWKSKAKSKSQMLVVFHLPVCAWQGHRREKQRKEGLGLESGVVDSVA